MIRMGKERDRYVFMSADGRLCCKSRKLQGDEFFAKTRNGNQSPICITSIAFLKSPVSLTYGDEVPHISTRKPHLQPAEFLNPSAKRLLQHNRPKPALKRSPLLRRFWRFNGHCAAGSLPSVQVAPVRRLDAPRAARGLTFTNRDVVLSVYLGAAGLARHAIAKPQASITNVYGTIRTCQH